MAEKKQDQDTLVHYDTHVRSVTTLCHMLWVSGDATRPAGQNMEKRTNPTVAILTNLAQSLRRHLLENVAVALDKHTSQVLVSNSPSEGVSESETYNQLEPDKLSRGLYSTNTINAGAKSLNSRDDSQDLSLDQLPKLTYRYVKNQVAKGDRRGDPRNQYPQFPSHARNVFRLFKEYLKSDPDSEKESMRAFELYVLAMSLTKLNDRIQEPKWKFRTKGALKMREFLSNENNLSRVPESIPIKDKTIEDFRLLLKKCEISMDDQTDSDITAKLFTSKVAIFFHGLLKKFFKTIADELFQLREKTEEIEFEKHLTALYKGLIGFKICTEQLQEMLDLYLKSLNIEEKPSTPGSCDDNNVEEYDEEIEDKTWLDAFNTWITRFLRQIRATSLLTSLDASLKTQVSEIDFAIIEQVTPNKSMESWKTTIKDIYGNEKVQSEKLCKVLSTIASGNAPDDKSYRQLKEGSWTQNFQGAIHCEAMLAVTQSNSGTEYQQHFGVSNRCCVACSFLLEEIALSRHGKIQSSFYLGTSNKIWGIALPPDCPISAAKKVSHRLDMELKEMLNAALPNLEARAKAYKSGGSEDEHSGQKDKNAFDRLSF